MKREQDKVRRREIKTTDQINLLYAHNHFAWVMKGRREGQRQR